MALDDAGRAVGLSNSFPSSDIRTSRMTDMGLAIPHSRIHPVAFAFAAGILWRSRRDLKASNALE